MTGLVPKAALLAACGLLLAGAAMAKCFSRTNSTLGPILVTDFALSLPLPNPGPLTSCFRDLVNNPCVYANVTVDFSTCGSDVEIAGTQERPDVTVNCIAETITMTTDETGCINLGPFLARTGIYVAGWPQAPGDVPSRNIGPAGAVGPCANVYVDGFLMGTVPVHVVRYDSDGDADVDASDLSFALNAVAHYLAGSPPDPPYRTFYDYDWDGDVDAGDVGVLLEAADMYFLGLQRPYQGAYCP